MTYLLDTNTVVALLDPARRRKVMARIMARSPGQVITSAVVAHELYYGAHKSAQPGANVSRLGTLFRDIEPVPFTTGDGEAAGQIRAQLAAAGTPIGPYDVLIAGQARARGITLVSNNTREFGRVHDLAVVDWSA